MWSVWSRALVGAVLVALGASVELYEQLPVAGDLLYQDDNEIDTGPEEMAPFLKISDVMMQRLLNDLHFQRIADVGLSNGPPFSSEDGTNQRIEHAPETTIFKDSVYKRLAGVLSVPASAHPNRALGARPQPKWKAKKGKSMVVPRLCYFKLCTFRMPA